jgi:hypothetical protein
VEIVNCEIDALYIGETDEPRIATAQAAQLANHSEIDVVLSGSTPIGYRSTNRGTALRITSASTGTTSTVRVTGAAAALILGTTTTKDGGGGLQGYAFGELDISGILVGLNSDTTVNNTLGRRLGNRSGAAVTMTVTVDGGTPVAVTFNENYTTRSNAYVLGVINSALGSQATASEYLVTQGEVYPQVLDKQRTLINAGTTGIPRFAAVRYVGPRRTVALMLTSDPASAFAGVALEPIPPGRHGRILGEGHLHTSQMHASSPGTVNAGTAVYHSDTTPGAFSLTGTRQAMTGLGSNFAYFKGAL